MSKDSKKPAIRFKGFTDDWEQRKFDDVFNYLAHNSLSRDDLNDNEGSIKNIHYGDVLIKFGNVIDTKHEYIPYVNDNLKLENKACFLQDGDVVIADAAEDSTVGKCTEISESSDQKIVSGLHTIPCRPKNKFAKGFLGYYLNSNAYHDQLLPLMQGTKVSSISKTSLKETTIKFPSSIEEQKKVGACFHKLDNLITLHQRKLDKLKNIKKALLEKMFPRNGENIPEVRFKGFSDDWEQRKLSDISERVTRKNKNLEYSLPLTISAQYGLVDQHEFFNKRIAAKDVSGYYVIKNGEFAYNKSYSEGYPWGAVKRLDRYENGVLSTLYILFSVKNVDSDFLVSYYDTNNWHSEVQQRSAEGARNHGLLNISASDFFDTELVIPQDPNEQKKIGLLFKKLDSTITLHQRKLDKLKNIKKALLEKMFV